LSFATLAGQVAPDCRPEEILKELLKAGAVTATDRRGVIPVELSVVKQVLRSEQKRVYTLWTICCTPFT
jgi:hypothetical protein